MRRTLDIALFVQSIPLFISSMALIYAKEQARKIWRVTGFTLVISTSITLILWVLVVFLK